MVQSKCIFSDSLLSLIINKCEAVVVIRNLEYPPLTAKVNKEKSKKSLPSPNSDETEKTNKKYLPSRLHQRCNARELQCINLDKIMKLPTSN